jgi:hypothetical protein
MVIYTIGHSTHTWEDFLKLLATLNIEVVADVRSKPYSRFNPQFNRETLASGLEEAGKRYLFLGKELGGKPEDPDRPLADELVWNMSAPGLNSRRGWPSFWRKRANQKSAFCALRPIRPAVTGVSFSRRNLWTREWKCVISWRTAAFWSIRTYRSPRRNRARSDCFNSHAKLQRRKGKDANLLF